MILSRTTLSQVNRQSLANLENIRQRRQRATDEISTGLRVRRPSDGPVEAAGVVRTRSSLGTLARFRANLESISDQMKTADGVLNQAADLLTRAATLGSQGSNFSQTAATRISIAVEVEGLIQNMITVANTELGGKFLFSGQDEDTRPFVPDSSSPEGVAYRGDTGRRSTALPGGTETPVSLDGRSIFLAPDLFAGARRTAGSTGAAAPNPPVGIGISFSGGLNGAIFADLPSFFVAPSAPTVPAAGNQVTVNFTSTDATISGSITAVLAGGETAAGIAAALNAQVALAPALAGRITFSDQGGSLKIVESDTAGVGFTFTSSATGGLVTGLESGGTIGGLSATEIASALNAQVALDPALASAGVRFTAVAGQVEVDGNVDFTFTAVDFGRGTGFVSGLGGQHNVGGVASANVFRVLGDLHQALLANDEDAIRATLDGITRGVAHISEAQGFYGATARQVLASLESVSEFELVNQDKLSTLQDADLVQSISSLTQAETNEQATLQVASRQRPSLFDFLA